MKRCAPIVMCNPKAKYRSFNGSCNNLRKPTWGASNTPFLRLLNAEYSDGIYQFRRQSNGQSLPGARKINTELFLNNQWYDYDELNVFIMQWGQFLAHDISLLRADDSVENCCTAQNLSTVPPQCREVIDVKKDDPVYSKYNRTCISFNRALTSANFSCPLMPATYMVEVTQYIDGSQVYGSSDAVAAGLRSFVNGKLRSDIINKGGDQKPQANEFCPQVNRTTLQCDSSLNSKTCYQAGDVRVNQNLGIALLQTLFLRFHNHIASKLFYINQFWTDEMLYQETRRIIGAVIQHITYTHYLPIILGDTYTQYYGLFTPQTIYNDQINPSTSLEFGASLFRILHSQIPAQLNFIDKMYKIAFQVNLTDWMDRPDLLPVGQNDDWLMRGLIETPGREYQASYNPLISNYLFRFNMPDFTGQDLLSIDIQRGRDVGLPIYNQVRPICGIPRANSFDDLLDLIPFKAVQILKTLYATVNDIDLHVGALLEAPEEGSLVGPTTRCILSDSFFRYKYGDRFFYDVQGQPGSFTPEQLKSIKQINLGHVICVTTSLNILPLDIFKSLHEFSSIKWNCEDHFKIDLEAWREFKK
ncbi:Haem peroxidase,Haem peroxidase, animal type [Cinara cedri]|uniref:Haem peroxidase,Haem peroxidase, animal type n=1 Tax=Cinara cedri TaxID=506608 RepID=A0A5E4LZG0_9HEMI|nr:Haem peroxidase,Haem peroxidase, animal type [Cinara cedri]